MTFTRMMIMAIFMLITGCTAQNIREGIYLGVYEGARIENRREMTPAERANKPDPDYHQYSTDRKERIENETR